MRWQRLEHGSPLRAFASAVAFVAQQVWLMVWFTSGCTSPRSALDRAEMSVSRAQDGVDSGEPADGGEAADGSSLSTAQAEPPDAGEATDGAITDATEPDAGSFSDEPQCGDGKVTGDERCDTGISAGETGACPTSCGAATNACQPNALVGSECDARCESPKITAHVSGDMCCPNGANAADDRDCTAVCGNDVTEPGETCDPPDSCPTCPASTACLRVTTSGTPEECNRVCESLAVSACASNDGCCPSGCTPQNDSDCSVRCGDGTVDSASGETCEPGSPTPCPQSCRDDDPCTDDVRTGSETNCNVVCTHVSITRPYDDDGCCWMGSNATADSDCAPVCGNGVVERNEGCDDGNLRPGDGCGVDCMRESATQTCLSGRENDACAQCTCERCSAAATSCRTGSGAGGSANCVALANCIGRTGCSGLECYCGSNLASCVLGDVNGPCRTQVEAATGSNNVIEIVAELALSDSSSPVGRAISLSSCERNQCEAECGR
jgi:cysteine-rich repeat protein